MSILRCVGKAGAAVWRKAGAAELLGAAERRCFELLVLRVPRIAGAAGTAGVAVLRRSVGLAFGWHPFDFSSRPCASLQLRPGPAIDTSKQTAGTAGAISGVKLSGAQCLRGITAETWREIAHGRGRSGKQRRPKRAGSGRSSRPESPLRGAGRDEVADLPG